MDFINKNGIEKVDFDCKNYNLLRKLRVFIEGSLISYVFGANDGGIASRFIVEAPPGKGGSLCLAQSYRVACRARLYSSHASNGEITFIRPGRDPRR